MRISTALQEFTKNYLHYKDRSKDTEENYILAVKSFIRSQGDLEVYQIHFKHIRDWKARMKRDDLALSTIRAYLSKIKNILRYTNGINESEFELDQIELPKVKVRFVRYLTETEVHRIMAACNDRDRAIVALLYASGLRVSELASMDIADVGDIEFSVVGKGDKQRLAFMNRTAKTCIKLYLLTRRDEHDALFLSCRGTRLKVNDIQRLVRNAAKRAGITKKVTPHVLRHSFATGLLNKGCDIRFIQELLGHADVSTTQLYTHVVKPQLRAVYQQYNA